MKQNGILMGMVLCISACQSGQHVTQHYSAEAVNAQGKVVSQKSNISSNKAGVELMVHTLCQSSHAKQVNVTNRLGHHIDGSPFQCR